MEYFKHYENEETTLICRRCNLEFAHIPYVFGNEVNTQKVEEMALKHDIICRETKAVELLSKIINEGSK